MFSSKIARVGAHVCSKSVSAQLKFKEIVVERIKVALEKKKQEKPRRTLLSYGCTRELLSTQEARVVLGYRLGQLLRFFSA